MRFVNLAVLILSVLLLSQTPTLAEKRVALVIGNSKYIHTPSLPNPANDAAAVTALLQRAGFEVVAGRNDLGIAEMRRAIREFADTSQDSDVAVVYYAGHGLEFGGTNFLVPVDARLRTDLDVEDEAVSLDRVLTALEPARKLRLIILDACRDNPFIKSIKRTVATRSINRGLAKVEPATPDTLIAFAAKAGAVADDDDGKNSPFTIALLKHLAVPGLDLRLAFGRVRDDVMAMTKRKQEPYVYGSLGGKVVSIIPSAISAASQRTNLLAPATFQSIGAFQGKTIQIEVLAEQKRKLPTPGIETIRRTISVYLKDSTEIPTRISAFSAKARASRTFIHIGTLTPSDGRPMSWSIEGNQLRGIFRGEAMVLKPVIQLDGTTCNATIAHEPPTGRTDFRFRRMTNNEPVIFSSVISKTVTCRVLQGDRVSAQ